VDARGGHVYWTNVGIPNLDLDGGNRKVIVPQGEPGSNLPMLARKF
jgi:hypothetical protein